MARGYTIQCSMQITQTRCTLSWTAGARQAGRGSGKARGREEGGREGSREGGGRKDITRGGRETGGGEWHISPYDGSL